MQNVMGKPKEECGVFGIYDKNGYDSARTVYYALYALQHRGQESCGMAVNDDNNIFCHKDVGLVPDVFTDFVMSQVKGNIAIGHVRYATSGPNTRQNAQPLVTNYVKGTLTIAHNGNLTNAEKLSEELEQQGAIFQSENDSEIIAYLIARERLTSTSVEEAVSKVIPKLEGAFSLLIMSPRKLIAVRDPYGIRPLCMGKMKDTYVFASEDCALSAIGAKFERDIEPGEMVIVDRHGIRYNKDHCKGKAALCIFEHIYFARPDSIIDGQSVYEARKMAGRILAQEHPVEADMVIGVPDSGLCAAIGYAEEANIPYGTGLIKNRYIGRTFIQLTTQERREDIVNIKLNVLGTAVKGKDIVMIDDSIVRGTTIKRLVTMLKQAGAKKVHVRISSPPFLWPCFFGTDISDKGQLVACKYTEEEIRQNIGADSLGYLSAARVKDIAPDSKLDFCEACFSGNYPFAVPLKEKESAFKKKGEKAE